MDFIIFTYVSEYSYEPSYVPGHVVTMKKILQMILVLGSVLHAKGPCFFHIFSTSQESVHKGLKSDLTPAYAVASSNSFNNNSDGLLT